MGRAPALIAAVLATACEMSSNVTVDAAIPDAPIVSDGAIDADMESYPFIGAMLDWDSTTAAPCPIVGAKWVTQYDTSRVGTTDADGAVTLPLTSFTQLVDVEPPLTTTTCSTPQGSYQIRGLAIVPPAIHYGGGHFVARSFTTARAASFYASFGSSFDATRAQLLVHLDGPPRAVSITRAHAGAQAFDGTTWSAGASGVDVYFPNIDLAGGSTTIVSVVGGAIGTGSVSLPAGKLLYLTMIPN